MLLVGEPLVEVLSLILGELQGTLLESAFFLWMLVLVAVLMGEPMLKVLNLPVLEHQV